MATRCVLVLSAMLLSACGASPQSTSAAAPKQERKVKQAVGSALTGYQQVMESTTIDGNPVRPDGRATAMVVFASWCGHCKRELAELANLRQAYPSLRIIGLNAYEEFRGRSDRERLEKFIADAAPWLTEIVSADQAMLANFGNVPRIPTLFLFDGSGSVVAEFRRDKRAAPSTEELDAAIALAVETSAGGTNVLR